MNFHLPGVHLGLKQKTVQTFLVQNSLPLSIPVAGAGEGNTDGSTRHRIVEQREGLRLASLVKSLELHEDQSARPVWAFCQMDKLSSPWILSLPGPESGMTSPVFREAMSSRLCAPSPACATRVGSHLGGLPNTGSFW